MIYKPTHADKLIEMMGYIVNKIKKNTELELRTVGLTFTQFGTLYAIAQNSEAPMSQRELASACNTDTTTIMVVCDSLEKKGFLRRINDPDDRRINRIEISDAGKKAYKKGFPLIMKTFAPVNNSLTDEEAEIAFPILQKMMIAVRDADVKQK